MGMWVTSVPAAAAAPIYRRSRLVVAWDAFADSTVTLLLSQNGRHRGPPRRSRDIFLFCDVNIRKRLRGGFDLESASYLREAGLGWLAGRSGLDALRSDGGAQAARSLGSTGYHDNNRRTEGLDQGSTERVARLQNDN